VSPLMIARYRNGVCLSLIRIGSNRSVGKSKLNFRSVHLISMFPPDPVPGIASGCSALLQIPVEPSADSLKPFDPAISATSPAQAMALLRKAHELRLHSLQLELHIDLLSLLNRTTQIILAVNDQRGRLGIGNVSHRAHFQVALPVLPWRLRILAEDMVEQVAHIA